MIETIYWHTMHPRYINHKSRVLDLGANYGHFARAMIDRFGCCVTAVEPSPVPFRDMHPHPRMSKLQLAVSDSIGEMAFHVSEKSISSSLTVDSACANATVHTTTLEQLLRDLGWDRVDLLKADIEGAEIPMFAACPDSVLQTIAQISVEFHDFNGKTPSRDVTRTLDRFHALGFSSVRMSRIGHQDTWLVNRRLCRITAAEILFTKLAVRNWFGVKRVAARQLARWQSASFSPAV